MPSFHNTAHGPQVCTLSRFCPFWDGHYETEDDAQTAFNDSMASDEILFFPTPPSVQVADSTRHDLRVDTWFKGRLFSAGSTLYVNDSVLHRTTGPAVFSPNDGLVEYWEDGRQVNTTD